MSELLGAICVLIGFVILAMFISYLELASEREKQVEEAQIASNIEFMAQYTEWAIQQEKLAEEVYMTEQRKKCSPSFQY